jgi:hypothetical protein
MIVSKTDAARSQLDTAIELYFQDGDEVAIHTLASAAYEVVVSLRTRAGFVDEIVKHILPERRAEFRQHWNRAQNFFKHADRDPEALLDFDPGLTEIKMLVACTCFAVLGRPTEPMLTFQIWFSLHHTDVLTDPQMRSLFEEIKPRWQQLPRDEFRLLMADAAGDAVW